MTLRVSKQAEAIVAKQLVRLLIEPSYENPNRVEAQLIAEALARKVAAEALAVLTAIPVRHVAPVTVEI